MNNLYEMKIGEIWRYLKRQEALFWLVNIYLFFEYIRPQTLYKSLDIMPYAQIVLILTLGIALIKGQLGRVKNPLNKLIVIYFLVILVSSFQAISPEIAFGKLSDFIAWMIIYFLIVNIVDTENKFLIFIFAFMLYSFKMSQFSFRNWLTSGFSYTDIGSGGGPGWFHNSGEFGIQMVIFFSIGVCFFWSLKEFWPRWKQCIFLLFPLTALTGTISSSSRGAVLGIAGVAFFWLLKSKYKIKAMLLLVVIGVVVYSIIPDQQITRFEAMGEDNTSISRIALWEKGLEMIAKYPFFGVGYENWLVAQERLFGIQNSQVCHNIFIQCASELGFIGLFVLFLMIIFTFVNNYRVRKMVLQSPKDNRFLFFMSYGLDGALVGYMISGFFVTVLYYPYFWINLAMTASLHEAANRWSGIAE